MLQSYLKIALRNIRKYKAYSLINVLGLAIGIACCFLIVLFVQDELKYDQHHLDGDRIYRVAIDWKRPNGSISSSPIMSYRLAPTLKSAFNEIEAAIRLRPWHAMVEKDDLRFQETGLCFADEDFFQFFTAPLINGDPATVLQAPFSIVLTEAVAQKYFGEEDPIGKTLRIEHYGEYHDWRVTGIMEEMPVHSHFHFDMMMSMNTGPQIFLDIVLQNWGEGSSYTYLRLPENYAASRLESQLPDFGTRHVDENFNNFAELYLQPLKDIHLKSHLRGEIEPNGDILYVYIFSAIAAFLLLIASINYMNLATARSANRAREVGMRKVLGAYRQQLITQFLGEAILITLFAVGLAFLIVLLFLPVFNEFAGKEMAIDVANNWPLLAGFFGLSLLVGIFAGSYPAFFLSAFNPLAVLKGIKSIRSSASWLRKGLVILQFSISIVLIICTTVTYNQLDFLRNKKLGIEPEQVVIIPHPGQELYATYKTEVLKNSDIISVTASNKRPTRRLSSNLGYKAEGVDPEKATSIKVVTVDYDFFETLGIEIIEGRSFSEAYGSDFEEGIILNEAAVQEIGWEQPLGKWFETSTVNDSFQWIPKKGAVVGVARNIHFESLHTEIQPAVFFMSRNWINWMSIKISARDMPAAIDFLKDKWDTIIADEPFSSTFLDEDIHQLYNSEARFMEIFIYFSGLAIFIACLGIFGLASYTAEQRRKEIGIRKTLGASIPGIVTLLSDEFTRLVLFANLLAWPIAYFYMQEWLNGFPYHYELGIGAFLFSAALAFLIAAGSVIFQALKAALANPVNAIRYE